MTTINYVWLNAAGLGPLEKFNIYSWRVMGCDVSIYSARFGSREFGRGTAQHDRRSLGLDGDDDPGINLYDMYDSFVADSRVRVDGDPRLAARDIRKVVEDWFNTTRYYGLDTNAGQRQTQIFNMVDLTKSYLGATRQGIVLDFKVGPSPHLQAYEAAFATKFISYSRGTLMTAFGAARVENQCIGTMQGTNVIRNLYATNLAASMFNPIFNQDVQWWLDRPKESHFGLITSKHAFAFSKLENKRLALNVSKCAPDGSPVRIEHRVNEIAMEMSRGPFRVFKKAGDQTNSEASERTTPAQVKQLAWDVWNREIMDRDDDFAEYYKPKVLAAWRAMPT